MESLSLELDAAKLATINECNKNAVLQNQLELSVKEKSALEREIISIAELKKENAYLKVSCVSFSCLLIYFPSRSFLKYLVLRIFCFPFCFISIQGSMDALESKNAALELALSKARKESSDAIEKLQEVEQKCSQLQENVKRFC